VPETLIAKLHETKLVQHIVPYALTIRQVTRTQRFVSHSGSAAEWVRSATSRIAKLGDFQPRLKTNVAVIDVVGSHILITVLQDQEVKAVRFLESVENLGREVFVTLQGCGSPDAKLYSNRKEIVELLAAMT